MSQDERRAMIVAAAVPLVVDHGAAVTTAQIARAAGIGEGTIFRAFDGKDDLLRACVAHVAGPDHVLRELAAIPMDQPLTDRLTDAIGALRSHMERMGAAIGALAASGRHGLSRGDDGRPGGRRDPTTGRSGDRDAAVTQTHDAVVALLEPDRDTLRQPPEVVADYVLRMLSPRRSPLAASGQIDDATLADLVVRGVAGAA